MGGVVEGDFVVVAAGSSWLAEVVDVLFVFVVVAYSRWLFMFGWGPRELLIRTEAGGVC